jgi:ABC-2 type transport system permease protein
MLRLIGAFLARDFRTELSYRLSFLMSISGIFFTAFTYFFVAKLLGDSVQPLLEPYGGDYFAFAIIGVAFGGYFTLGLSGFARALRQAQTTGTLEAMMMTPTPVSSVILGSAAWSYAFTTLRVVVYLGLGVILGVQLGGANYLGGVAILVVAIITFASIGIIAASIIMVVKRGDPVTTLFGAFATLVGGVFYPIEIMPVWLQRIASLLPITYALRAMRLALLQGASWSELLPDLLVLLAFAVVLFPVSLLAFRVAVERARADGSLAHY